MKLHIYRQFRERFSSRIRTEIIILLTIFILIPFSILQAVNIKTTSSIVRDKNQDILDENLRLTSSLINEKLSAYKDLYFNIFADSSIQESIITLNTTEEDTMVYRRIKDRLETAIRTKILLYPEIRGVGFITPNNIQYLYAENREKNQSVIQYFFNNFSELNENYGKDFYLKEGCIKQSDKEFDLENPSFFLCGGILDYERLKLIGTLVIFIDSSVIGGILNNNDTSVYEYTTRAVLLPDHTILYAKDENIGQSADNVPYYAKALRPSAENTSDLMVTIEDTEYMKLQILSIVDYSLQNQQLDMVWCSIAFLSVTVFLLAVGVLYFIMGKQLIHPIEHISFAMDHVTESDLGAPISRISHNELGSIVRSYNQMISHIKRLLKDNELQMKKTYEAELKSLELQINPHFIFNTLDTINWTALQTGADNVSILLTKLADILRYTVYGINQVVPIQEDIEWIHQYLGLQRIRFHNKFNYDILYSAEIKKLHIHKLLLEPLLENSLIHGFDEIKGNGYIQISYRILKNRFLVISIADNGGGIEKERLTELRKLAAQPPQEVIETTNSIGVANVIYRLKGYYKGSHIMISSGHGSTVFKLYIPVAEMEDTYEFSNCRG